MKPHGALLALSLCLTATFASADNPAAPPVTTAPSAAASGTATPWFETSATAAPQTAPAQPVSSAAPPAQQPSSPAPLDTTSPDSPNYVPPVQADYSDWQAQQSGQKKKRRSTGMLVGGAILAGLGGLGFLAGVIDYAIAEPFCNGPGSTTFDSDTCVTTYQVVGITGMVTGGIMLAIGIPLAVIGGGKPRAEPTASVPELRIGPGSASLRWHF